MQITYPLISRQNRLASMLQNNVETKTATTASGTPNLTAVSPVFTSNDIGKAVFGANIGPGAVVVSISGGGADAVLSVNSTGTASAPIYVVFEAFGPTMSARLFKSSFSCDVTTVLANLTPIEANFDAYAPIVVTWTLGFVAPGSTPTARTQLLSWLQAATPTTPNTIYGWWIDDGTNIVLCETFDNPLSIAVAGDEIALIGQDSYPPGQDTIIIGT